MLRFDAPFPPSSTGPMNNAEAPSPAASTRWSTWSCRTSPRRSSSSRARWTRWTARTSTGSRSSFFFLYIKKAIADFDTFYSGKLDHQWVDVISLKSMRCKAVVTRNRERREQDSQEDRDGPPALFWFDAVRGVGRPNFRGQVLGEARLVLGCIDAEVCN